MSSPSSDAGYRSAAYAQALASWGAPHPFGETGGHLLLREIPKCDHKDLMGPYPVFSCADWSALGGAVSELKSGNFAQIESGFRPLSLTLVTDPFCPLSQSALSGVFDMCRRLSDHMLIDLTAPLSPSKHHRKKLRKAGPARIEAGPADPAFAASFAALYAGLAEKKNIQDMRRFDAESLAAQIAVPGAHLVTAWTGETLLGADLYYLDGAVAYAHLSAYAPEGYALSVSYPMIEAAAGYFADKAGWIDLGGTPAQESGQTGGGVGHFKRGWTQQSRPTYLCGARLDQEGYAALSAERAPEIGPDGWFPAYRAGEFTT